MLAPLLGSGDGVSATTWALLAALILSGLATVIAMTRTGIDAFWASPAAQVPRVQVSEVIPIMLLLALCLALTIQAGPVMRYMEATAQSLHVPRDYVRSVVPAPRAPERLEKGGP